MSRSLAQAYLHVVFSTKHRHPWLADQVLRDELFHYLGGACRQLDSPSLVTGGVADQVHILCRLGRSIAMATLVRELKRESSKWLKTKGKELAKFHWQDGYGAFSISPGHVEPLRKYIAEQEEHHKTVTFQDEYRRLLRKYGVEYDERYVWD